MGVKIKDEAVKAVLFVVGYSSGIFFLAFKLGAAYASF